MPNRISLSMNRLVLKLNAYGIHNICERIHYYNSSQKLNSQIVIVNRGQIQQETENYHLGKGVF